MQDAAITLKLVTLSSKKGSLVALLDSTSIPTFELSRSCKKCLSGRRIYKFGYGLWYRFIKPVMTKL